MKLSIFLLFISTIISGQNLNRELKIKYGKYDSINTYSKEFPTKLIEGSGTIKNKKKRKIGSIGFSTEITKNSDGKLIRIKNEKANHYDKKAKQIAKSESSEITIYFDENEKPEFAKYITETYISEKLIKHKTNYYDLKSNVVKNYEITEIQKLIDETKK